jgi:hypothetical protein
MRVIHDGFRNRYTILKDGKTIIFISLSLKQVYDDQLKLKKECEVGKSENSCEDNGKRRPSYSTNFKSIIKVVESGGRTRVVKKVNVSNDHYVEKLKKQPNFYAKEDEIKFVFYTNKLMILLVYKETYFNSNDLDHVVPSVFISLLHKFDNVLPEEVPNVLPPLKGTKH